MFKVGDKVELVKVDSRYEDRVGYTGTITDVMIDTVRVRVDGSSLYSGHTWHKEYIKKVGANNMSVKYYRNLKDNFLWAEGAILSDEAEGGSGYRAISDLWDKTEENGNEYISSRIVESEDNKDMFERVYPIGDLKKMLFGNKKAARAAISAGAYKAKK